MTELFRDLHANQIDQNIVVIIIEEIENGKNMSSSKK
jgi:hypothetical protein